MMKSLVRPVLKSVKSAYHQATGHSQQSCESAGTGEELCESTGPEECCELTGYVDVLRESAEPGDGLYSSGLSVSGWVSKRNGEQPDVDVYINGRLKGSVQAQLLRQDLFDAGFHEGRGFTFSGDSLEPGANEIEIRFAGTGEVIPNGRKTHTLETPEERFPALYQTLKAIPARVVNSAVYAPPRTITDISQCHFYHTVEIPGHGVVGSAWDLRGGEEEYLGGVDFRNKRVLEMGTATGYLCRYMESQGAEVVGFDLPEDVAWDAVPYAQADLSKFESDFKNHIQHLKNSWWFCHRIFHSKANVVYGDIYHIPKDIGFVDISTFGSILLHLRDPFLALRNALRLTKETVIVTDLLPAQPTPGASMAFCPDFRKTPQPDTWWALSPEIIVQFLGILGFEMSTVSYHKQKHQNQSLNCFTVVGQRTRKMPAIDI